MKKNLRDKIHTFLQSENGKVGIKSPLTLSIVSSSLLLAQMILTPHADAGFEKTMGISGKLESSRISRVSSSVFVHD